MSQTFDAPAAIERSLIATGSFERIGPLFASARRGKTVTIGAIGGSVTQGAWADSPDHRYLDRIAAWWHAQFPAAPAHVVNAGRGGTQSNYGALRVARDLLAERPDFVIVEFSVNDDWDKASTESYEGLVRHILHAPNHPAVLLLFLADRGGGSAQPYHRIIGTYYNLPMVSLGDALRPCFMAGDPVVREFYKDDIHPNDRGHGLIAQLVTHWLDKALASADGQEERPLTSAVFEHADIHEDNTLPPEEVTGWTYSPKARAWEADRPGAALTWSVRGSAVFLAYFCESGPWGTVAVTVDAGPPVMVDAWSDRLQAGQERVQEIARDLPPGPHRVTVRLLPDRNVHSQGHRFRLFGIGTSGP